jgi:hypothetical protein
MISSAAPLTRTKKLEQRLQSKGYGNSATKCSIRVGTFVWTDLTQKSAFFQVEHESIICILFLSFTGDEIIYNLKVFMVVELYLLKDIIPLKKESSYALVEISYATVVKTVF